MHKAPQTYKEYHGQIDGAPHAQPPRKTLDKSAVADR